MGLWASENSGSGDSTESVDKLVKQDNWMLSPGVAEGGIVLEGTNAGTFKVTAITKALLRTTANATGSLEPVTLSEQDNQVIPVVDTAYFIVFTYGTPCTISLSTSVPNGYNEIPLGKVAKDSSGKIYYVSGGYRFGDGVSKLHKRAMSLRSLELKHGSTIAYSGTNNFTLTPGIVFGGLNEYLLSAYDSAVTQYTAVYNDGVGGWTKVANNAIDYAHYDDLSGTLKTIKNNQFGVHYLFKHVDDQNVYVVYGLGSYALAEAILQASQLPDIPPHLLEFGVLIGSIVVPQTGGSFTEILSPTNQFYDCTQVADHANLS
ncbi:MAG: hypothetical protein J7L77_02370, partial [Clostridiales bacterium]|nr:hypothetical protein [Clostridiales bacterium]